MAEDDYEPAFELGIAIKTHLGVMHTVEAVNRDLARALVASTPTPMSDATEVEGSGMAVACLLKVKAEPNSTMRFAMGSDEAAVAVRIRMYELLPASNADGAASPSQPQPQSRLRARSRPQLRSQLRSQSQPQSQSQALAELETLLQLPPCATLQPVHAVLPCLPAPLRTVPGMPSRMLEADCRSRPALVVITAMLPRMKERDLRSAPVAQRLQWCLDLAGAVARLWAHGWVPQQLHMRDVMVSNPGSWGAVAYLRAWSIATRVDEHGFVNLPRERAREMATRLSPPEVLRHAVQYIGGVGATEDEDSPDAVASAGDASAGDAAVAAAAGDAVVAAAAAPSTPAAAQELTFSYAAGPAAVWSLGALLYEMVALRPPCSPQYGPSNMEVMEGDLSLPSLPDEVSQSVAGVLRRMLSPDPRARQAEPRAAYLELMQAVVRTAVSGTLALAGLLPVHSRAHLHVNRDADYKPVPNAWGRLLLRWAQGDGPLARPARLMVADMQGEHNNNATGMRSVPAVAVDSDLMAWCEARARGGDPVAQWLAGSPMCFPRGEARCIMWLARSCRSDVAPALYALALQALQPDGSQLFGQAADMLRRAAEQGFMPAMVHLAACYKDGIGVPQSYADCLRCFHKAAKRGFALAEQGLGAHYHMGKGVPQDGARAKALYMRAAEQGLAPAQAQLAQCYLRGECVAQDTQEAVKWLRRAAEQGDEPSQYSLARCYAYGSGVSPNPEQTVYWLRRSAANGNETAQALLRTHEAAGGVMFITMPMGM